jgi:hypothetical protein
VNSPAHVLQPNNPEKEVAAGLITNARPPIFINPLIEKHHRLEREIRASAGDLWTPQDTADDIANVIVCKLPTHKAERVARAMLAKLKEQKASEKGAIP